MSACSVMSQGSPPRNTLGLKPASAQRGGSIPDQQMASPDPDSPDPPEVTPPESTLVLNKHKESYILFKEVVFKWYLNKVICTYKTKLGAPTYGLHGPCLARIDPAATGSPSAKTEQNCIQNDVLVCATASLLAFKRKRPTKKTA